MSTLEERYASPEMVALSSKETKYTTWRKLWIALAKGQEMLGLPIGEDSIQEMEKHFDNIDFKRAFELETLNQHEVSAHLEAFIEACPAAKGKLHLAATSAFVMDNGDLIFMKRALQLIETKLKTLLESMQELALTHVDVPCLAFTHLQPASPITVGRRIALWIQDLYDDYLSIKNFELPFLGTRGATGTAASLLLLFDGDEKKIAQLNAYLATTFGFNDLFPITTQTYPRKWDAKVGMLLTQLALSTHKISTDLRLLAHMGEIKEPFKQGQIGSSAMPHKQNPILSERISSLSRLLMNQEATLVQNASLQWLERTLDDSASRRITLPQSFLLADSILLLMNSLFSNLQIDQKKIKENLERDLSKVSSELALGEAIKKGISREDAHQALRGKSTTASIDALIGLSIHETKDFLSKLFI